jgi:hypothetical protein
MFAIMDAFGRFIAALSKSRSRLEAKNALLRHWLNVALRQAPVHLPIDSVPTFHHPQRSNRRRCAHSRSPLSPTWKIRAACLAVGSEPLSCGPQRHALPL